MEVWCVTLVFALKLHDRPLSQSAEKDCIYEETKFKCSWLFLHLQHGLTRDSLQIIMNPPPYSAVSHIRSYLAKEMAKIIYQNPWQQSSW